MRKQSAEKYCWSFCRTPKGGRWCKQLTKWQYWSFSENTKSRRKMVRTKGDGGASRTVASKAPRKALGGGGASSRWGAPCRKIFPNLTKDDQAKEKLLYDDLSELAKRKVFFHVSLGMVVFSNILKSFPTKVIDRKSFQGSRSNRRSCRRRISSRRKIFRF